jgi:hypothetical protein
MTAPVVEGEDTFMEMIGIQWRRNETYKFKRGSNYNGQFDSVAAAIQVIDEIYLEVLHEHLFNTKQLERLRRKQF